jgi:hypothetical protein
MGRALKEAKRPSNFCNAVHHESTSVRLAFAGVKLSLSIMVGAKSVGCATCKRRKIKVCLPSLYTHQSLTFLAIV